MAIIEVLIFVVIDCFSSRPFPNKCRFAFGDMSIIANETRFAFRLYDLRQTGFIEGEERYILLPLRLYVVKLWTIGGGFCKRYRMSCLAFVVWLSQVN
ncbi:calcineurin B-like protein 10 [Prunus dulcis]|uniref:Calcineurin B-like protein 10 n=1 Tax=Prunus dulcis TaxID=3755 RepID=A0A5H2XNF5_PRUDU|nr:calcineurin B-like protein 10 [Prunus dulcis]